MNEKSEVEVYNDVLTETLKKNELIKLEDAIINSVCLYFNINVEEIKSKSRKREYVFPRQIAIHTIFEATKKLRKYYTLKGIG